MSVTVNRRAVQFNPDPRRVITRFYAPGDDNRARTVIQLVLAMSHEDRMQLFNQVLREFSTRHRNITRIFDQNFKRVEHLLDDLNVPVESVSRETQYVIGAYFTKEYSIESAAFFNPSIVEDPYQGNIRRGQKRIILSFRATGEGHLSSIVFRSGIIDENNEFHFEAAGDFTDVPEVIRRHIYDKRRFLTKLAEMNIKKDVISLVMDQLEESFNYGQLQAAIADTLENKIKIPTHTIPGLPVSTVQGHQGFLVFGEWKKIPIAAVQGRTHFYEGYAIDNVAYIVRVLAALGIKTLVVTNAAGGINPAFRPGDLMLITDQINLMFCNPLRGPVQFDGERFPDMSQPYALKYFKLVQDIADENGIALKSGVLFVSSGPSYETAAEVRMIQKIGADAASMSTVPEVIVARQIGLDVIGISCITNFATGLGKKPLNHAEVTETANLVQKKFLQLISGIITRLDQY